MPDRSPAREAIEEALREKDASGITEQEMRELLMPDGFGTEGYSPEEAEPGGAQGLGQHLFWLSYSRKRRFARLHRTGACSIFPGTDVNDFEGISDLAQHSWSARCKLCWKVKKGTEAAVEFAAPPFAQTIDVDPDQSVESSDESSSTDFECDEVDKEFWQNIREAEKVQKETARRAAKMRLEEVAVAATEFDL